MISFSLGIYPQEGLKGSVIILLSISAETSILFSTMHQYPCRKPQHRILFSPIPPTHFFGGNSDLNGCKVMISQCFRLSFPWWCVILGILYTTITHRNQNKEKCHLWRIDDNVGIWMEKWEKSGGRSYVNWISGLWRKWGPETRVQKMLSNTSPGASRVSFVMLTLLFKCGQYSVIL